MEAIEMFKYDQILGLKGIFCVLIEGTYYF